MREKEPFTFFDELLLPALALKMYFRQAISSLKKFKLGISVK